MSEFTVLIVDNDAELLDEALTHFQGTPDLRILTANSVDAARTAIRSNFLHLAFVDMHLRQGGEKNVDGKAVLRVLADSRPWCKRVLITKYVDKYADDIFGLLHPLSPLIHGAMYKVQFREDWNDVISKAHELWRAQQMTIGGIDQVYRSLAAKRVSTDHAELCEAEVREIIGTLMRTDDGNPGHTPQDIHRIDLTLLAGGRSRSVIAAGRPESRSGEAGIWCVIKIGPREEIAEEHRRYARYVRFLVSLNRRVEHLGYAAADTIGAMCYSFAGPSPDTVTSLERLFESADEQAIRCIEQVFDAGKKEWFARTATGENLGKFFSASYGLQPSAVLDRAREFMEKVAPELGARKHGDSLVVSGQRLVIPSGALGSVKLRGPYRSCIVHGDLNAGNVIVSGDGRVFLIDYRHTGWGPALLDFAAVETSVRVFSRLASPDLAGAVQQHALENRLWTEFWANSEGSDGGRSQGLPYWARISTRLFHLARANFPEATAEEYASTCLLWALRIFRVSSLSDVARMRLLVWMSALDRVVTGSRDRGATAGRDG